MTYWVIAKFNNNIYLTADIRASKPQITELAGDNGWLSMKQSVDVSEKLFVKQSHVGNATIKIALCTSGFAGLTKECTIAHIIQDYFRSKTFKNLLENIAFRIINRKTDFDGQIVIKSLINFISQADIVKQYIPNENLIAEYFKTIDPKVKNYLDFSDYIMRETNFGIGLLVENNSILYIPPSIASWNGSIVQAHDDIGYLESSFKLLCLQSHSREKKYRNFAGQFKVREFLDDFSKLSNFNPQAFMQMIITTAAKTNIISVNACQGISEVSDFAALVVSEDISPNNVKIFPKTNIMQAKTSYYTSYGSQATPIVHPTHNPLNDPSRMSGSERAGRSFQTQDQVRNTFQPQNINFNFGLLGINEAKDYSSNNHLQWGKPVTYFGRAAAKHKWQSAQENAISILKLNDHALKGLSNN